MSYLTMSFVRPMIGALALAGFALSGCGNGGNVSGISDGFDRAIKALSGPAGQSVPLLPKGIKGTYGANCKVHKNENWALTFGAPVTVPPAVEMALNDTITGCPLLLKSITVQEGSNPALKDYPLATPFNLGRAYPPAAASVNLPAPATGFAFYANARLTGLDSPPTPGQTDTYFQDFIINTIWSDDKSLCELNAPPATYATVKATAVGSSVPPPNYGINWDALSLKVDANKIVQSSSSGSVILQLPAVMPQVGQEWKLFSDSPDCCGMNSFAEIDTFYRTGNALVTEAISGSGNITIAWDKFALLGVNLTTKKNRYIIIKNTGVGNVVSYELMQIVFAGPQP